MSSSNSCNSVPARRDRQSRPAAIIRALALENIGAVRPVHLAAKAASELVDGRSEIGPGLPGLSDDDLPIAVHESNSRCPFRFLHEVES